MQGETGLLEAIREAGFVYWGLFVAFALILAAYLAWMRRTERAERGGPEERPDHEEEGPATGEADGRPAGRPLSGKGDP